MPGDARIQGIPKALVAERLATLGLFGILERRESPHKRGALHELTECGRELKAVCDAMGEWATCRLVDLAKGPGAGVVVRLELTDDLGHPFFCCCNISGRKYAEPISVAARTPS